MSEVPTRRLQFLGELPAKPTAMMTWCGIPIICTHEGPPCFVQHFADGRVVITPITPMAQPESNGTTALEGPL